MPQILPDSIASGSMLEAEKFVYVLIAGPQTCCSNQLLLPGALTHVLCQGGGL